MTRRRLLILMVFLPVALGLFVFTARAADDAQTPSSPPVALTQSPATPPGVAEQTPTIPLGATNQTPVSPAETEPKIDKEGPAPGTKQVFHDIEFVWIPGGEFTPGITDGAAKIVTTLGGREEWFADEAPRAKATFPKGLWMSRAEITRSEWSRVMGTDPWKAHDPEGDPNLPATWVTWEDAAKFAKTLGQEDEPPYRLPAEDEWEYACLAGATTMFPFGDAPDELAKYAWYRGTVTDGRIQPVATKEPNAWGLCDMLGNAWEWCSDVYAPDAESAAALKLHVIRGGGANQPATFVRPTVRMGRAAKEAGARVGFRVVREP